MKYGITHHRRAPLARDIALIAALLAGGAVLTAVLSAWLAFGYAVAAATIGGLAAIGTGHAVLSILRSRLPW